MPFPKSLSPSDALAVFHAELARAAVSPGPPAAGPALWRRFAGYYQGLARLPRKARRALQRRWRRSLGGLALLLALGQAPALAATIVADGATCTLIDAITAANNNTATGGCSAGSGADTITLPANSTHTLTAVNNFFGAPVGLPVINSAITIEGNGSSITRDSGAPPFRILTVNLGASLTLRETTVSGGQADVRAGGLSNRGALSLINSTVSHNSRVGLYNYDIGTATLTNSTISGNSQFGVQNRGTLYLTLGTVSGNSADGLVNDGTATLTNSTVSGNSATGFFNDGTATLTNSTVSGNSVGVSLGGVHNRGTLILTNSTVSANSGHGIFNDGTVTVTQSIISGNHGCGIFSGGAYTYTSGGGTVTGSTVSGNILCGIANINRSALTVTNSTVSGNSHRGGAGVSNTGTLTLTNSIVSGNLTDYGGVVNLGVLILTHTLISGNTAGFLPGRELRNSGTVITDNFNLFGRNGISGVQGVTPGPTDIVPNLALIDILDPRLSDNGGPTPTHALAFGSSAVDAVPAASCATATDQRGITRPQDDDGNGVADCDIGAFEGAQAAGPPPLVEAEAPDPKIPCTGRVAGSLSPATYPSFPGPGAPTGSRCSYAPAQSG